MKYLLIVLLMFLFGCTTFMTNEAGVRKACKSGVKMYDDGTTHFECVTKEKTDDKN